MNIPSKLIVAFSIFRGDVHYFLREFNGVVMTTIDRMHGDTPLVLRDLEKALRAVLRSPESVKALATTMGLPYEAPPDSDQEIERLLVAFGSKGLCEVLASSGALVEYEDREQAVPWRDVFGGPEDPKRGIWVWEGKPFYVSDGHREDPDTDVNWDNGHWREPTPAEWAHIVEHGSPWTSKTRG